MRRYLDLPSVCLLCAHLLSSGCALDERTDAPAPTTPSTLPQGSAISPTDQSDSVTPLLQYVNEVRKWPTAAQRQEYRRVEQSFARDRSIEQWLRLALLLIVPATEFHDEQRAYELLTQSRSTDTSQDYQAFANFLIALLNERAKQREHYHRLEGLWEEEQQKRKTLENHLDSLKTVEQRWAEERKKRQTLRKQLDALKAIEKTINKRDQPEALPLEDVEQRKNPPG